MERTSNMPMVIRTMRRYGIEMWIRVDQRKWNWRAGRRRPSKEGTFGPIFIDWSSVKIQISGTVEF